MIETKVGTYTCTNNMQKLKVMAKLKGCHRFTGLYSCRVRGKKSKSRMGPYASHTSIYFKRISPTRFRRTD